MTQNPYDTQVGGAGHIKSLEETGNRELARHTPLVAIETVSARGERITADITEASITEFMRAIRKKSDAKEIYGDKQLNPVAADNLASLCVLAHTARGLRCETGNPQDSGSVDGVGFDDVAKTAIAMYEQLGKVKRRPGDERKDSKIGKEYIAQVWATVANEADLNTKPARFNDAEISTSWSRMLEITRSKRSPATQ